LQLQIFLRQRQAVPSRAKRYTTKGALFQGNTTDSALAYAKRPEVIIATGNGRREKKKLPRISNLAVLLVYTLSHFCKISLHFYKTR